MAVERTEVGIWWELPPGARWANEGVSRVVGFLIEGAAVRQNHRFHLVVQRGLAAEVREDLRSLAATEGVDWQVHEPDRAQEQRFLREARSQPLRDAAPETAALALFANATVDVEGWVVTFPHFTGANFLKASKGVLMPDAIPYDFPLGWEDGWGKNGYWPTWRRQARAVCASADAVINFSDHVATRHSMRLLDIPRDKIHVVPLAPPDLVGALPFVRNRTQTPESRALAAAILRDHAAARGLDYLRNFPFDQCDFVVGATQDRPTKNLGLSAEAVERIVRRDRRSLKLFLTAQMHFGAKWTRLPHIVDGRLFHRDVQSLHNLPRTVHAALFHAASLTIHASFYEGIIGCLPLFESVSVGTPCLFARGPHAEELLQAEPGFRPYTFDPYDRQGLIKLIHHTLDHRAEAIAVQQEICERLRRWTWSDVADGYVAAAMAGRQRLAA
jgi:glycosyltransferase involved in cell wall biosynthesis